MRESKSLALPLGYTYLDTGAMYRSATYLALQNGLTDENVPEILDQLSQHKLYKVNITFKIILGYKLFLQFAALSGLR